MTEALLALVPEYGLWIVAGAVFAACFALPVPASLLVLTAGAFAGVGDLSPLAVLAAVFAAFGLGDLLAFSTARWLGRPLLTRLRRIEHVAPALERSEALLRRRGRVAIVISHTMLSPTGPYVTMLSGAGQLPYRDFAVAALPGAAIWTLGYAGLGYAFASRLDEIAAILGDYLALVPLAALMTAVGLLIRRRWHQATVDEP